MEQHDDPPPAGTVTVRLTKRINEAKGITVKTARQICSDAAAKGSQIILSGQKAALKKLGEVQSVLGEDYQQIVKDNPLVKDSLSRAPLLDHKELLSTAFNLPWMTAALWGAAAGAVVELQHPISHVLGGVFHYGPGHVRRWAEVNQYMDSVAGSGHRLKFGHTVDFLPRIYERFGIEGVPAFFLHLLQDFFTQAGLPLLPNAWDIKRYLEDAGLPRQRQPAA